MPVSQGNILLRHRRSLVGSLRLRYVQSEALGIRKPFYVYEPPGLAGAARVPVLYLFRGHEREWVNLREDASRNRRTAVEALDAAIAGGALPPVVAVLPGLNSTNNHVPSLGIDMAGRWPPTLRGLGTGRFWHFLAHELLPRIERDYPETGSGARLMAGFSLGGFTVSLLATHLPGFFHHAGIYDGLFMWPGHDDPRQPTPGPCSDPVWCRAPIFDAALGRPRDAVAMRRWNPSDILQTATGDLLASIRKTAFFVRCASGEGNRGNRDRAHFFVDLLRARGVPTAGGEIVFHPEATHSWHWTDRFLLRFLEAALGPTPPGTGIDG